jgi:ABC-2 type transport system ATP-binding protein
MIQIQSLSKKYGSFLALDNISCVFNDETVTALMGANGAGKSTLLKICAGVLSYKQGKIWIDGHSLKDDSKQVRKNIGYLPEMPYLYNRLTGKEFLLYLASLRNIHHAEKEIEEFADLLGISDALDLEINGYSKGMKQKISMIAALFHHPHNLLLDEPVWGLDPLTAKTLEQFIMNQHGTTLIATHSGSLVEKVADYVYFLMNGTIVASESVKKLLNSYETIEDAYFSITGL